MGSKPRASARSSGGSYRKPTSIDPHPFPEGIYRNFEHLDGRVFEISVSDCRVYQSTTPWGNAKLSIDDAQHFAVARARKLIRDGFIEVDQSDFWPIDLEADVVKTIRSLLQPEPATFLRCDFRPIPGASSVFKQDLIVIEEVPSFSEYLICNEKRTRAIFTRTADINGRRRTPMSAFDRDNMAEQFVGVLAHHREGIMDNDETPVRVFELQSPIGRFEHFVVLSPTLFNYTYKSITKLRRSLWFAFLCYENEFIETDSVTFGDARYKGRRSIPYIDWNREPHFVVDLRHIRNLKKPGAEHFLVFSPAGLRSLETLALSKMKFDAIDARNHKGEIQRFLKHQVTDINEVREFFL